MSEYGFFNKMDYLEVIVKNDKNSKGGRQQQIYMIYFGSDEMTSVLTPPEVQNNGGVQIRELQDYIVSVDTAKHICLKHRTEKDKQCRQYLIDLEKAWNTPEQVMARALKVAGQTIDKLKGENTALLENVDYKTCHPN